MAGRVAGARLHPVAERALADAEEVELPDELAEAWLEAAARLRETEERIEEWLRAHAPHLVGPSGR